MIVDNRPGAGGVIGIASRGANPLLRDVAPVANTLPGYEMTSFAGIAAPGATPRAIITRLNRVVNALLALDEIRRPLLDAGGTIAPIDPAGMDHYIAGEIERWRGVARTRGISIRWASRQVARHKWFSVSI